MYYTVSPNYTTHKYKHEYNNFKLNVVEISDTTTKTIYREFYAWIF